ncbi:MAG: PKD domain-containing protein [Candidatus Limnocylindrales bacterium]
MPAPAPRLRRTASQPHQSRLERALHPATRGQALVEFAIVLPVMLLLMLLAIDFGRLFFSYIQVNNAAREGAAYGAANPGDTAGITARADQETDAQSQRGESALVVSAACTDTAGATMACSDAPGGAGAGNHLTVTAVERFTFLTPLIDTFFGNDLHMSASATSTVLGFAASAGGTPPPGCVGPDVPVLFNATVSGMTVALDASAAAPNSGLCAISGYNWDMGDGATVFGKQTSYDYSSAGTYTITLQVTNQGGSQTGTTTVTVPSVGGTPTPTPSPSPTMSPSPSPVCGLVAGFSWQSSKNGSDNIVAFQGYYSGQPAPTSWAWTFSGGNPATSSNQNESVTFPKNNKDYSVTLTVSNGACSATSTQTITTGSASSPTPTATP